MTRPRGADARRRCTGDRGAVVVEAALVIPLFFALFMALFDFGLLEFRQSQLSSAARDGARVGIIHWDSADIGTYAGGPCPAPSSGTTSASFNKICTAVLKRLAGSRVTTISVRCFVGPTTTVQACSPSVMTGGVDTIEVTVTMNYAAVTPVGQTFLGTSKTYTESTRMVIQ